MKKILASILGIIVGYIAWQIVYYAMLLSGPFILGPMGISGPRAAEDLESGAQILGFVVFVVLLRKVYLLIVHGREKKSESANTI